MKLKTSKKTLLLVLWAGFGAAVALSPGGYMQVAAHEGSHGISQYSVGTGVESCARYVTTDKRKRFMDEVRKRGLDDASNAARVPSSKLMMSILSARTIGDEESIPRLEYLNATLKSMDMVPKNRQEILDGLQEIEEQLRTEYATEALEHSNCLKQHEMNRANKPN